MSHADPMTWPTDRPGYPLNPDSSAADTPIIVGLAHEHSADAIRSAAAGEEGKP